MINIRKINAVIKIRLMLLLIILSCMILCSILIFNSVFKGVKMANMNMVSSRSTDGFWQIPIKPKVSKLIIIKSSDESTIDYEVISGIIEDTQSLNGYIIGITYGENISIKINTLKPNVTLTAYIGKKELKNHVKVLLTTLLTK